MDTFLPTPEAFLAGFGLDARPAPAAPAKKIESQSPAVPGNEFRSLLVAYCATCTEAYELSQIKWGPLAKRLGTHTQLIEEVASQLDEDGTFWHDVLGTRIKRVTASQVFRNATWERLESLAVDKLVNLAERNMIRDPGELLAIASAARRANTPQGTPTGGTTVNVNFGEGGMNENGLPAAGTKMTIDLSPRIAKALNERSAHTAESGARVIDGEMLSATELRSMLESQRVGAVTDADDTSDVLEGDQT